MVLLVSLLMMSFLASCSKDRHWSGLDELGLGEERVVFVPYDEHRLNLMSQGDKFALHYFVTQPFVKAHPTVLYCAGGPGQIVTDPTLLEFLAKLAAPYNVVYFHIRGAGKSQFPQTNNYDQYLRSKFAVRDIERIRKDLGIEKWHAIVGLSYGSVLAQQYAGLYGKGGSAGTDLLEKLVLVAPVSLYGVLSEAGAEDLVKKMAAVQLETLRKIYTYGLKDVSDYQSLIAEAIATVLERVDLKFGSLQFVIDEYERLANFSGRNLLKENNLEYSHEFFKSLRLLRSVGWLRDENQETRQDSVGLVIVRELASKIDQLRRFSEWQPEELSYEDAKKFVADSSNRSAQRVYKVMSVYDGLDARFLKFRLAQGQIQGALRSSAGEVHSELCGVSSGWQSCREQVNPYVEKVGLSNENITAWDPAKFPHQVPTLILKGGADPVSAGDEEDRIYYEALRGSRSLIKFPGIGHPVGDLDLPLISRSSPLAEDGPCKGNRSPRPPHNFTHSLKECLLYSFLTLEFEQFKNAPLLNEIETTFERVLKKMGAQSERKAAIFHCPEQCDRGPKTEPR